MTMEIKKNAEATVIEVVGRLDTTSAPALEKAISEDIGDAKNLVLDLKSVQYISSAGLRVLLGAQKKMQKQRSLRSLEDSIPPLPPHWKKPLTRISLIPKISFLT